MMQYACGGVNFGRESRILQLTVEGWRWIELDHTSCGRPVIHQGSSIFPEDEEKHYFSRERGGADFVSRRLRVFA